MFKAFIENLHDNFVMVITVVMSLMTAVPAAVALLKWLAKKEQGRNYDRWQRSTLAQRDIDRTLRRLQSAIGAQHVLMMASHNGGGFPKPGSPSFISVTAEVTDGTVSPIAHRFSSYPVDYGYRDQVLVPMLSGVHVEVATADIASLWLKDLQESRGVVSAYFRLVSAEPKNLLYLVIHFAQPPTWGPSERNDINEIVDDLKKIISSGALA